MSARVAEGAIRRAIETAAPEIDSVEITGAASAPPEPPLVQLRVTARGTVIALRVAPAVRREASPRGARPRIARSAAARSATSTGTSSSSERAARCARVRRAGSCSRRADSGRAIPDRPGPHADRPLVRDDARRPGPARHPRRARVLLRRLDSRRGRASAIRAPPASPMPSSSPTVWTSVAAATTPRGDARARCRGADRARPARREAR